MTEQPDRLDPLDACEIATDLLADFLTGPPGTSRSTVAAATATFRQGEYVDLLVQFVGMLGAAADMEAERTGVTPARFVETMRKNLAEMRDHRARNRADRN